MGLISADEVYEECSVCGRGSGRDCTYTISDFSYKYLDFRIKSANELIERIRMGVKLHECPNCGYVARSLKEPIICDKEYLNAPEYKSFTKPMPVSRLARRFLRRARISLKAGNYVEAFKACLNAAWASDDEEDEKWQIEMRMSAIRVMDKFSAQDMTDKFRLTRADLLRKTLQFDRLVREYENVRFQRDLFNKIVRFQILKAKNKDSSTYMISNARSYIEPDEMEDADPSEEEAAMPGEGKEEEFTMPGEGKNELGNYLSMIHLAAENGVAEAQYRLGLALDKYGGKIQKHKFKAGKCHMLAALQCHSAANSELRGIIRSVKDMTVVEQLRGLALENGFTDLAELAALKLRGLEDTAAFRDIWQKIEAESLTRRPEAAASSAAENREEVIITEPAAVALLKNIYQAGRHPFEWDFSIPGQVRAFDGRLTGRDGALTILNLGEAGLGGTLKVHDVESLAVLDARENYLDDIDFKNLPGLKGINLYKNRIENISPLAGLTALTRLNLGNNQIKDLGPLAGLAALTELDISRQEGYGNEKTLSDLSPLKGMTSLAKLDISRNVIRDLGPLRGLTNLTELNVWDNTCIDNFSPLAELTNLKKLNLCSTYIKALWPLAGLTALSELNLDLNRMYDLGPLAGLTALTKLSLSGDDINDLKPLAGMKALTDLCVMDYNISDLGPLAGMKALRRLNLCGDNIRDLGPLAELKALTKLTICSGNIRDLRPLAGLTTLKELAFDCGNIRDIRPLAGLTNLTELNLTGNKISDVSPLAGLTALTNLYLFSKCFINDLSPLAGLTNLARLELNYNKVGDLRPLWGLIGSLAEPGRFRGSIAALL